MEVFMSDNMMVELALQIALDAHRGQVDKGGTVYILHPLRLMHAMDNDIERVCALLHDVVEDSELTLEDLVQYGFPETLIEAVGLLTKTKQVTFDEYLDNIKQNPIAKKVKLADLRDNSRLERIKEPTEKDLNRLVQYHRAIKILSE
jgi:(p)ppGpp synthase/HD superfamily hydrolase